MTVADTAPEGVGLDPERLDLELGPGEEVVIQTTAVPTRRGPIGFGAAAVRVAGPLGVAFRQRSHPETAVAAVAWPDVLQLRDATLLPPGRRLQGERTVRGEAAAREFESLRDYVRGDEYRRIAWKATARRGRPVVVMHQPERGQTLLLALEAGRLMHGAGGEGLGKIDRAVNAAVMLTAVAREYGDAVGLVAFSHRPLATLAPSTRAGQLRRVVDAVAPLEPELVEPDWRTCLGGLMRMSRRRAVVVVFSDALYAQTDDRLAALLGTLARRHVVVFASIRDSELTELAAQPVHDAGRPVRARRRHPGDRGSRRGPGRDPPPGRAHGRLEPRAADRGGYGAVPGAASVRRGLIRDPRRSDCGKAPCRDGTDRTHRTDRAARGRGGAGARRHRLAGARRRRPAAAGAPDG